MTRAAVFARVVMRKYSKVSRKMACPVEDGVGEVLVSLKAASRRTTTSNATDEAYVIGAHDTGGRM